MHVAEKSEFEEYVLQSSQELDDFFELYSAHSLLHLFFILLQSQLHGLLGNNEL